MAPGREGVRCCSRGPRPSLLQQLQMLGLRGGARSPGPRTPPGAQPSRHPTAYATIQPRGCSSPPAPGLTHDQQAGPEGHEDSGVEQC